MRHKYYADVKWVVEDILDFRPEWTEKMAEDFLVIHQEDIREALIEHGWQVMETLMNMDGI